MPDPVPAITEDEHAALVRGEIAVTCGYATIRAVHANWTEGFPIEETRLVMYGPSGRHSLLIVATDLDRLNAHWTTFASHPLNEPTRVAA